MKIKTRRYYIYYLAVFGGFIVAILPIKFSLFFANLAGKVAYALLGKYREQAIDNLKNVFPEKSDTEVENLVKKIFSNFCKMGVELLNIYKLNKRTLFKWIETEGLEDVKKAFSEGKGAVMLASHFGNWELTSTCFSLLGFDTVAIARRIYFDRYDKFINNVRQSKGVEIIYRDESPKKILRALKQNKAIGILADQDVDSVDGVFVEFFGRQTFTPKGPVALAIASGAPLIPTFMIRQNGRHKFLFEKPMEIEQKATKEETIQFNTQKWSRVVESYIRKYPDQWVWVHKRWKTKQK